MITLDRLRYFIEVAQQEHVGKSARKLSVSPSVISSAIKLLEDELGCELFIRAKQRLKLTDKGRLLLEKAQELINNVELLPSSMASGTPELRGHFKLGAPHFLMHDYLIPAFIEIRKSHPKLTVDFVSMDSGLALSQTQSGILDGALVFRSSYTMKAEETVLSSGFFKVVVRKNHPLLLLKKNDIIEELNRLPAITFRTATGQNFWENHPVFESHKIKPLHTFFYNDLQDAFLLLSKTDGWAFLPDHFIKSLKSVSEVSLPKNLQAPVNISMVRSGKRDSALLLDKLTEVLKRNF